MSDVEENARIASTYEPLSAEELERIEEIIGRYSSLLERFCTGCGYCQPCPSGVRIPEIFNLVNFYRVYGVEDWARQEYERMRSGRFRGSVDLCVVCGECEEKCPLKISIRDELKKAHTLLTVGEYTRNG